MRKCNKCKIKYNGNLNRCPLCQSELIGKVEENVFLISINKKKKILNKILLYVTFSIALLFSFFEYTISKSLFLSKFVVLGLITIYILTTFILNNYKNVLKMLNRYFFVILFLLFVWYLLTKSLLITTYFIPILCIIIFVYNSVTMLVLRDSYIIKFIKTILLDCFVGLIPLLLVYLNLSTRDIVSYICVVLDILVFFGLLIFCKNHVIDELKKMFHF